MASTAAPPARAFYGPISPAILGFDWEEEEEEELGGASQIYINAGQEPEQPAANPQGFGSTMSGYFAFNPALLRDFDDDAASEASGMATNGGSVVGEETGGVAPAEAPRPWTLRPLVVEAALPTTRGEQKVAETTRQDPERRAFRRDSNTDRAEPGGSNNPYAAVIEEKHNAMTVAFLRSPTGETPIDSSSSVTPDDLGYAPCLRATCCC